jgi:predicted DNA-binding transcriptional regulator YafY
MSGKEDYKPDRIINLFKVVALLYFSGRKYSLTEIRERLELPKTTAYNLMLALERSGMGGICSDLIDGQRYWWFEGSRAPLDGTLTTEELTLMSMCLAFTKNLLGKKAFAEAEMAVYKSRNFAPGQPLTHLEHFSAFMPGSLDYTPHQEAITTLIQAMVDKNACRLLYQKSPWHDSTEMYVKPYKLFTYNNAIYLHAGFARTAGKKYREAEYDPILPMQRIMEVEKTDRRYQFPNNYDFSDAFNLDYGVMRLGEPFRAKVRFSSWAAIYVAERQWSPDQEIKQLNNGQIELTLTVARMPEFIGWVLWFGESAKLLMPRGGWRN